MQGSSASVQSDTQSQLPGVSRLSGIMESMSDSEDDDVSIISLGEARRIAQLRIDGVGLHSESPTNGNTIEGGILSSTVSPKKTLPPIEPLYRKKAVSALKRVLKQTKGSNGDQTTGLSKKQIKMQKKVAKKAAQEEKKRIKKSKKKEKLTTWLEKTKKKVNASGTANPSTVKQGNGLNNLSIANEHAKIAELHKCISDMEKKRSEKQQRVSQLMTRMESKGSDWKFEIKKLVKSLKRTEDRMSEIRAEILVREDKIKLLTTKQANTQAMPTESGSVINREEQESSEGQARRNLSTLSTTENEHNSSESDSSEDGQLHTVTVTRCPKSKVFKPDTSATHTRMFPPRPSTAVRRFSFTPDMTAINYERGRLVREMKKVEEYTREQIFQRPLGAHHSRVRSVRENVQEFLPYELERCDSDTDDETDTAQRRATRRVASPGAEGMRKFEESQRSKTRQRPTTVKKAAESADDFDFVQVTRNRGASREDEDSNRRRPITLNFYRQ